MRRVFSSLTAAVFAVGLWAAAPSPAEARYRRGDAVAFGVAAAVISGIVANEVYRRRYRKRHYVAYHRPVAYYRPAYIAPAPVYYQPAPVYHAPAPYYAPRHHPRLRHREIDSNR